MAGSLDFIRDLTEKLREQDIGYILVSLRKDHKAQEYLFDFFDSLTSPEQLDAAVIGAEILLDNLKQLQADVGREIEEEKAEKKKTKTKTKKTKKTK